MHRRFSENKSSQPFSGELPGQNYRRTEAFKTLLGNVGVFLLPSLKMKSNSSRGKTYEAELHDFLLEHFTGYTVTTGSISGYWKTAKAAQYGEHREYKVAFSNAEKISLLEGFIAHLAAEIGEEDIYYEIDNRAWLLHANFQK